MPAKRVSTVVVSVLFLLSGISLAPTTPALARQDKSARTTVPALKSAATKSAPEPIEASAISNAAPGRDAAPPVADPVESQDSSGSKMPERLPPATPKGFVEGKSKESKDQRQANAKTFDNPDGTQTVRIYSKPVHFKERGGEFKELDNRAMAVPGGFKNAAGPVQTSVAEKASAKDLARISAGGDQLSFSLEGATDVTASASGSEIEFTVTAQLPVRNGHAG